MKKFLILIGLTVPGAMARGAAALAHGGHVATAGHGHSHWLAVASLGAIAVIGSGFLYIWLRSGRRREIQSK